MPLAIRNTRRLPRQGLCRARGGGAPPPRKQPFLFTHTQACHVGAAPTLPIYKRRGCGQADTPVGKYMHVSGEGEGRQPTCVLTPTDKTKAEHSSVHLKSYTERVNSHRRYKQPASGRVHDAGHTRVGPSVHTRTRRNAWAGGREAVAAIGLDAQAAHA